MNNDRNGFDPMLNIPSMEELDRQWREREAAQQRQRFSGAGRSSSGQRTAGRTASSSGQRAANGSRSSNGQRTAARTQSRRNPGGQRTAARTQSVPKQSMTQKSKSVPVKGKKMKKPKKFKKFRLFLKIFFLVLLLGVLAGLMLFYFKYGDDLLRWKNEAKQIVEDSNKNTFRETETSTIYAANKKPIAKLRGDKDSSYINFDEIPQEAIDCMVVTEDRDFYEHSGVNLLSTLKAAALLVKSKMTHQDISRGGSTITQQLAKNVFLNNEQTYERKIREMFFAIELEKKYSKDEIMEFYMNNICFANGHFGIEAASKAYFSKSAKDLDLAEIAFICAIPNRPTLYNPLENYDKTNARKERILKQLLEAGKITTAQYSDAVYEKIVLDPAETIKTQDYMTTYAIACATKALMKKQGFEFKNQFDTDEEKQAYDKEYKTVYEECHSSLYTGGYEIYTSLSNSKQKKLQKSINTTLKGFKDKTKAGVYKLQGAATCIDNETGFVVAIVGGRKQKKTTGYTLNRAFQSYRQPGSCFKPLVVYTPQLERGYTASSIVDDSYFKGGPKNSSNRYSGKIPLRTAVEQSKNVVAWRLFKELTPKVGLSYVKKMNFAQIVDSDYYLSSSLGGLTNGASTVEMASGYATIENDGVYRDPTCVVRIKDGDGNVIVNNKKNQDKKQVYEETASRVMTDILQGVLIRGTARGHALSNMASAGKTGTTNDKKDGWFCGYTPYYTTVVWVGYDSPKTLSDLYGSTYPLTIWENYMTQIHEKLEEKEFKSYSGESSVNKRKSTETANPGDNSEPTIEPDAVENTQKPATEETQKPTVTRKPQATAKPTKEPQVPDDNPEDIPDDNNPEDIPQEEAE